jgi:hypothetical protein
MNNPSMGPSQKAFKSNGNQSNLLAQANNGSNQNSTMGNTTLNNSSSIVISNGAQINNTLAMASKSSQGTLLQGLFGKKAGNGLMFPKIQPNNDRAVSRGGAGE